jgi:3-oxoacyl-[acyl-carrier protein] reductase
MGAKKDKKRALVLGGSCQLALRLIPCLVSKQIQPLVTYRTLKAKAAIQTELAANKDKITLINVDLTDPDTLLNLEDALKQGVDYLVDFAHSDYECLVAGAKDTAIYEYFNANISVRTMVLKRVARCMLTNRFGRLVFISSTAAKHPNHGQGFYAASKAAAEALYRNLGLEMASKGITTAILRPGFANFGRGQRYLKLQHQRLDQLKKKGRIITPDALNNAILFLLAVADNSINGTVLTLDGGMTIGKTSL